MAALLVQKGKIYDLMVFTLKAFLLLYTPGERGKKKTSRGRRVFRANQFHEKNVERCVAAGFPSVSRPIGHITIPVTRDRATMFVLDTSSSSSSSLFALLKSQRAFFDPERGTEMFSL